MNSSYILSEIKHLCKKYDINAEITTLENIKFNLAVVSSSLEKEKLKTVIITMIGIFIAIALFFAKTFYELNKAFGVSYAILIVGLATWILLKQIPVFLDKIKELSFLKELLIIIISSDNSNHVFEDHSILKENKHEKSKIKKFKKKENKWIYAGGMIVLIAISVPFLIMLFSNSKFAFSSFEKLGVVGDFFGGTTVGLFTLASMTLVIAAIVMQKEELAMQRTELQETRKVAKEQSNTITMQRFENTFFQMVTLHNEIVNSIDYEATQNNHYIKREYFEVALHQLRSKYQDQAVKQQLSELQKLKNAYDNFFRTNQVYIGHYYRNMYRIIKFIDNNKLLSDGEKKEYVGMLKAQLSSYELVMLLYNGTSIYGKKFLYLMRKYNLLDNLNPRLLIHPIHFRIYSLAI